MRIEDLRIGNYVDVVLKENNTPIRCEVIRIDYEAISSDFKDIDDNSVFTVDTKEKWTLVKEVATTKIELKNLEFTYDPELYLDMFSIKGAWFIIFPIILGLIPSNPFFILILLLQHEFFTSRGKNIQSW